MFFLVNSRVCLKEEDLGVAVEERNTLVSAEGKGNPPWKILM